MLVNYSINPGFRQRDRGPRRGAAHDRAKCMTEQSRTSGISTGWESAHQLHNQAPMTDLLLFIVIVAFFAACIAYVRAMDRI
jgi:hypothetical protein